MTPSAVRRILLVGFMCSGKSTVGRRVAERLGWGFIDVDDTIVTEVGTPIAVIFEERGEAYFRDVEERLTREAMSRERVVIATGGGWGAAAERLRSVPDGTATVHLRVSPEVAAIRAAASAGSRPLLSGQDTLSAARNLLSQRLSGYASARWEVDTADDTVEDVSARILEILEIPALPNEVE